MKTGIFECCSSRTSQFLSIHERDGRLWFSFISLGRLYYQISPNLLKKFFIFCQIVSFPGKFRRGEERRRGANLWWNCRDMIKYELRVQSLNARVERLKARVKIQKCEFKSTSYEFKFTSYKFKYTSSRIIKSMKTQANILWIFTRN